MEKCNAEFTVYFEEPFWVGLYEVYENGLYEVCRVVFGAEMGDAEVYEYVLKYQSSFHFSPKVTATVKKEATNRKRLQKEIHNKLNTKYSGTKSQQAISLGREQFKSEKKSISAAEKRAAEIRAFEQKADKKREKHKGH